MRSGVWMEKISKARGYALRWLNLRGIETGARGRGHEDEGADRAAGIVGDALGLGLDLEDVADLEIVNDQGLDPVIGPDHVPATGGQGLGAGLDLGVDLIGDVVAHEVGVDLDK